ncbi:MAG: hypothetical protein PHY28_00155 [Dehalococcoidales bacterium]|nr:hypothetical protein [Dehalococcoidales bacterium]
MSVTCEICGDEFSNSQGLAGLQKLKHGDTTPAKVESPKTVTARALPLKYADRWQNANFVAKSLTKTE